MTSQYLQPNAPGYAKRINQVLTKRDQLIHFGMPLEQAMEYASVIDEDGQLFDRAPTLADPQSYWNYMNAGQRPLIDNLNTVYNTAPPEDALGPVPKPEEEKLNWWQRLLRAIKKFFA